MVGNITRLISVFDELGAARDSELFNKLLTGASGSLICLIGTQGAHGSPLQIHIADLLTLNKPYRYAIHVRQAAVDKCESVEGMGDEEQWNLANPCLGSSVYSYADFRATYEKLVLSGNANTQVDFQRDNFCLLYTSPSPRD